MTTIATSVLLGSLTVVAGGLMYAVVRIYKGACDRIATAMERQAAAVERAVDEYGVSVEGPFDEPADEVTA